MNAMPKHVVSTTLENPGWNTVSVIKTVLKLAATRVFDSGVVMHTYHPATG